MSQEAGPGITPRCPLRDVEKLGCALGRLHRNAGSTFYLKVTGHAQKPSLSLVSLKLVVLLFSVEYFIVGLDLNIEL